MWFQPVQESKFCIPYEVPDRGDLTIGTGLGLDWDWDDSQSRALPRGTGLRDGEEQGTKSGVKASSDSEVRSEGNSKNKNNRN